MTTKPRYRVAVWGPGDLGSCVIREAARHPEIELVGAFCYSEAKHGKDIGEIAGVGPVGVTATKDLASFLALDTDVVIHTALDQVMGDVVSASQADFVKLLEAGHNVVTSQPYNHFPSRDPAFAKAVGDAAERGQATFFASGIDPGFIVERWALTMTTLASEITQIRIGEYFDCRRQKNDTALRMIGLGGDPAQAMDDDSPALLFQRHYYPQMFDILAKAIGVEISRVGVVSRSRAAPEDLRTPPMVVRQGETGSVAYEWTGYVDDDPFFVMELVWYLTPLMRPDDVASDDHWAVTIEGRPSIRSTIDVRASFADETQTLEEGAPAVGFVATANCLIHAIPFAINAAPGLVSPPLPAIHWVSDLRGA